MGKIAHGQIGMDNKSILIVISVLCKFHFLSVFEGYP